MLVFARVRELYITLKIESERERERIELHRIRFPAFLSWLAILCGMGPD